jgi:hypothetical protein
MVPAGKRVQRGHQFAHLHRLGEVQLEASHQRAHAVVGSRQPGQRHGEDAPLQQRQPARRFLACL